MFSSSAFDQAIFATGLSSEAIGHIGVRDADVSSQYMIAAREMHVDSSVSVSTDALQGLLLLL